MHLLAAANKRPEIARAFTFFQCPALPVISSLLTVKNAKRWVSASLKSLIPFIPILASTYVNDFTIYNRSYHVIVQADTLFRNDIAAMDKYYVRNYQGIMLPLGSVMSYKVNENASMITHYNLYRYGRVCRQC